MNLTILTPEKEVFNGTVKSIKVPGSTGQFEVLNGHAAIVSSLVEGEVRILDEEGQKLQYTIQRGFIEVINDEVSLLVRGLQTV